MKLLKKLRKTDLHVKTQCLTCQKVLSGVNPPPFIREAPNGAIKQ